MNKFLVAMLLLSMATACDTPQRNRLPSTIYNSDGLNQPTQVNGDNVWGTGTGGSIGGNTGSTTGSNTNTTTTRPPGFENCDISAKYYVAGLNYMGICQSTLDETSVVVNSTVSDSARTCMIPTFKNSAGSSTYLGQPQCFAPIAGQVSTGQLFKSREGYYSANVLFTSLSLNGVMVMKENSLSAYFTCMDAIINFPASLCPNGPNSNPSCSQLYQQCPNGANSSQYCSQVANTDRNAKCNNFKADHPYIDIRLKN